MPPAPLPAPPPEIESPALPGGPCQLGADAVLNDPHERFVSPEVERLRVASATDRALLAWARIGRDEVEGWGGPITHFALATGPSFPSEIRRAVMNYSSAVSAPMVFGVPIGGESLGALTFGAGQTDSFGSRDKTGGFGSSLFWGLVLSRFEELEVDPRFPETFNPKAGIEYEPAGFVTNDFEASGSPGGSLLSLSAAALVVGHDIEKPKPEDCLDDTAACHGSLFGSAGSAGIVGYPRVGPPWFKRLTAPGKGEFLPRAISLGKSKGAYIFQRGDKVYLGVVGAKPEATSEPEVLRTAEARDETAAMIKDDLRVVWSERASRTAPWRLFMLRRDSTGAADVAVPLDTGPGAAYGVSLTASDGRFVLAWIDEDRGQPPRIRALAFGRDETPSLRAAPVVVDAAKHPREAHLASSPGRIWLAWSAAEQVKEWHTVHVSAVQCGPR
jgi:hypothetical protein